MTNDNFAELKKLFEMEVERLAKIHLEQEVGSRKDRWPPRDIENLKEHFYVQGKVHARKKIFAQLLDGYSIADASYFLSGVRTYIEENTNFSAEEL